MKTKKEITERIRELNQELAEYDEVGVCTMLRIFRLENRLEELKWVIKDEEKRSRTKRS